MNERTNKQVADLFKSVKFQKRADDAYAQTLAAREQFKSMGFVNFATALNK